MNLLLIDLTGALRPKAKGYNFHFKITGTHIEGAPVPYDYEAVQDGWIGSVTTGSWYEFTESPKKKPKKLKTISEVKAWVKKNMPHWLPPD